MGFRDSREAGVQPRHLIASDRLPAGERRPDRVEHRHQGGDDPDGHTQEGLPIFALPENAGLMKRELVIPEDVRSALDLYPEVRKVWDSASLDNREVWLRYIEEAENRGHREQRIDIMISGLRP